MYGKPRTVPILSIFSALDSIGNSLFAGLHWSDMRGTRLPFAQRGRPSSWRVAAYAQITRYIVAGTPNQGQSGMRERGSEARLDRLFRHMSSEF